MGERTPAETAFLHFLSALYRLSMQSCAPTQSAFSYPLSFRRLCQHSFPLPLPVATVNSFVLSCYGTTNISHPVPAGHTYPLRCFAPQWARFDNRHSTSAPTPTLAAVSGSGAGIVSRPGASVSFVSDGPISSNSGRNGGKNAGRNCVSALPQRATVGCDFPHLLAGITFHHRCRSKGLRVRSPARRLTRPLAPATVGVFRSYRRPLQAFPLEGSAVLNDTPVACQTRGPTRRETGAPISRRR